ncbi:hypothetical protein D4Q80_00375, partial [bacterium]
MQDVLASRTISKLRTNRDRLIETIKTSTLSASEKTRLLDRFAAKVKKAEVAIKSGYTYCAATFTLEDHLSAPATAVVEPLEVVSPQEAAAPDLNQAQENYEAALALFMELLRDSKGSYAGKIQAARILKSMVKNKALFRAISEYITAMERRMRERKNIKARIRLVAQAEDLNKGLGLAYRIADFIEHSTLSAAEKEKFYARLDDALGREQVKLASVTEDTVVTLADHIAAATEVAEAEARRTRDEAAKKRAEAETAARAEEERKWEVELLVAAERTRAEAIAAVEKARAQVAKELAAAEAAEAARVRAEEEKQRAEAEKRARLEAEEEERKIAAAKEEKQRAAAAALEERLEQFANIASLKDTKRALEEIKMFIESFLDNIDRFYPKEAEGIVRLNTDVDVLVIPDLHARWELLIQVLRYQFSDGETVIEKVVNGRLQILFLGDLMHTDNGDLWMGINIERVKQGIHNTPKMDKEMLNSLGTAAIVMLLKAEYPENVHILKGNHDNIANSSERGNRPYQKYAALVESYLVEEWVRENFGKKFLDKYAEWENRLPIFAIGRNFVASHSEPDKVYTAGEIDQRGEGVVHGLTWTRQKKEEETGIHAEGTLKQVFGDKWDEKYYIVGHSTQKENGGIRDISGKRLIIVNSNQNLPVLYIESKDSILGNIKELHFPSPLVPRDASENGDRRKKVNARVEQWIYKTFKGFDAIIEEFGGDDIDRPEDRRFDGIPQWLIERMPANVHFIRSPPKIGVVNYYHKASDKLYVLIPDNARADQIAHEIAALLDLPHWLNLILQGVYILFGPAAFYALLKKIINLTQLSSRALEFGAVARTVLKVIGLAGICLVSMGAKANPEFVRELSGTLVVVRPLLIGISILGVALFLFLSLRWLFRDHLDSSKDVSYLQGVMFAIAAGIFFFALGQAVVFRMATAEEFGGAYVVTSNALWSLLIQFMASVLFGLAGLALWPSKGKQSLPAHLRGVAIIRRAILNFVIATPLLALLVYSLFGLPHGRTYEENDGKGLVYTEYPLLYQSCIRVVRAGLEYYQPGVYEVAKKGLSNISDTTVRVAISAMPFAADMKQTCGYRVQFTTSKGDTIELRTLVKTPITESTLSRIKNYPGAKAIFGETKQGELIFIFVDAKNFFLEHLFEKQLPSAQYLAGLAVKKYGLRIGYFVDAGQAAAFHYKGRNKIINSNSIFAPAGEIGAKKRTTPLPSHRHVSTRSGRRNITSAALRAFIKGADLRTYVAQRLNFYAEGLGILEDYLNGPQKTGPPQPFKPVAYYQDKEIKFNLTPAEIVRILTEYYQKKNAGWNKELATLKAEEVLGFIQEHEALHRWHEAEDEVFGMQAKNLQDYLDLGLEQAKPLALVGLRDVQQQVKGHAKSPLYLWLSGESWLFNQAVAAQLKDNLAREDVKIVRLVGADTAVKEEIAQVMRAAESKIVIFVAQDNTLDLEAKYSDAIDVVLEAVIRPSSDELLDLDADTDTAFIYPRQNAPILTLEFRAQDLEDYTALNPLSSEIIKQIEDLGLSVDIEVLFSLAWLIFNGIDAVLERPDVKSGEVRVRCFASGRQVDFQISDNGTGLDLTVLSTIFEKALKSLKAGRSGLNGGQGMGTHAFFKALLRRRHANPRLSLVSRTGSQKVSKTYADGEWTVGVPVPSDEPVGTEINISVGTSHARRAMMTTEEISLAEARIISEAVVKVSGKTSPATDRSSTEDGEPLNDEEVKILDKLIGLY